MARGQVSHKHAFRMACEDQRSWADDPQYTLGMTWCRDRATGSLFKADEMTPETVKRSDCPKCAAAMGAHKLRGAYRGRVRLEAMPEEDRKASDEYGVKYAKGVYRFILDGTLRGYIIAAAGFGKGWSLHRVAGALDFARDGRARLVGDKVSGDRPSRYGPRVQMGELWPIHYAARDAMACAAVRLAEKGDLPTVEEQEERRAAAQERAKAESEARERDRVAAAQRRAAAEHERTERMQEARDGLATLLGRADLSNGERAGVVSAMGLLGFSAP